MDTQFEMTGLSSENIEATNNRFDLVLESLCDLNKFYQLFPAAKDKRIIFEDVVLGCSNDCDLARLLAHVITNRNITNPDDLSEYIVELTNKQQPLALELLKQVSIRTRKFSG